MKTVKEVIALSLESYLQLREKITAMGYGHEIDWADSIQPVSDAKSFWAEFSWVVLNSGMKNQIAKQIWDRVRPAVEGGDSASTVFGHKGKSSAIDFVWQNCERLLKEYLAAEDKIEYLHGLPWIGNITKWHLAKNFGHDCAKPDRHLVRIAGEEGVHNLCSRLSRASGDRIATVDLVIWRAANLGLV